MTRAGKIAVNLDSMARKLAMLLLVLPFFFAGLDLAGISAAGKLLLDGAWILLALIPFIKGRISVRREMLVPLTLTGMFFLLTLLVYLARWQSLFYYLWGLRNYARFYVFFFAVAGSFWEEDGNRCLDLLDRLFWPNFLVCLLQFAFGYRQDCLGGLFGVAKGCNGYTILYFSLILTRSVLQYLAGEETAAACFGKLTAAILTSAMAELKFFFLIIAFILAASLMLTPPSGRKLPMLLLGAAAVCLGGFWLGRMYGEFRAFLTWEGIQELLRDKHYATGDDLGRFSAVFQISRRFLKTPLSRIFGLGLGNCDTSSFALLRTPFYETYRNIHYTYFSYAFLYLETGFAGLGLYLLFFAACVISAFRGIFRSNPLFCRMGALMGIVCIMLTLYNASLRTEAGFLAYFALALPFLKPERGKL